MPSAYLHPVSRGGPLLAAILPRRHRSLSRPAGPGSHSSPQRLPHIGHPKHGSVSSPSRSSGGRGEEGHKAPPHTGDHRNGRPAHNTPLTHRLTQTTQADTKRAATAQPAAPVVGGEARANNSPQCPHKQAAKKQGPPAHNTPPTYRPTQTRGQQLTEQLQWWEGRQGPTTAHHASHMQADTRRGPNSPQCPPPTRQHSLSSPGRSSGGRGDEGQAAGPRLLSI